jgi:hypothetical protein
MTYDDITFLRQLGIDHRSLGDPSPGSLPAQSPAEGPVPALTAEDARWLLNLGVTWEHGVEPEFIPPRCLEEYLSRHPDGIREAVGEVAADMGLALPGSGLDHLAREVTRMFVDFAALGLEDVVELYGYYKSMRPGLCGAGGFHAYVKLRVTACVPVALKNDPHGDRNG